jgi:hypothetical protein
MQFETGQGRVVRTGARIVIVGNGPVPEGAASAIASADLVIRFNDCRSFHKGERTDVVAVCNTGRPGKAMLHNGGPGAWTSHPAVRDAGAIWCVRDPALFAALQAPLAITHPELDDFCDDETGAFRAFAAAAAKAFRVLSGETQRTVEAALSAFSPAPYIVPSSGMVVIADVLSAFPEAEVALAGFTHQGWEGHPFAAEARLTDHWIATGRLRRLDRSTSAVATVS